ncbi:MAG: hypothetical protein ACLQGP_15775 [Isosphaeraceae bacterium]
MPDDPQRPMTDAEIDEALARLWSPGAWEKMLSGVRDYVRESRAKGFQPATTAALLRDAMQTELAALVASGSSDADAEVVSSTFNRAIDRILTEATLCPTPQPA